MLKRFMATCAGIASGLRTDVLEPRGNAAAGSAFRVDNDHGACLRRRDRDRRGAPQHRLRVLRADGTNGAGGRDGARRERAGEAPARGRHVLITETASRSAASSTTRSPARAACCSAASRASVPSACASVGHTRRLQVGRKPHRDARLAEPHAAHRDLDAIDVASNRSSLGIKCASPRSGDPVRDRRLVATALLNVFARSRSRLSALDVAGAAPQVTRLVSSDFAAAGRRRSPCVAILGCGGKVGPRSARSPRPARGRDFVVGLERNEAAACGRAGSAPAMRRCVIADAADAVASRSRGHRCRGPGGRPRGLLRECARCGDGRDPRYARRRCHLLLLDGDLVHQGRARRRGHLTRRRHAGRQRLRTRPRRSDATRSSSTSRARRAKKSSSSAMKQFRLSCREVGSRPDAHAHVRPGHGRRASAFEADVVADADRVAVRVDVVRAADADVVRAGRRARARHAAVRAPRCRRQR